MVLVKAMLCIEDMAPKLSDFFEKPAEILQIDFSVLLGKSLQLSLRPFEKSLSFDHWKVKLAVIFKLVLSSNMLSQKHF